MARASIFRRLGGYGKAVVFVLGYAASLAFVGCGPGVTPLPSASQAREAVQVALEAWKGGRDPESLKTATPPVAPVDFDWKAGKTLVDFAIGPEETVQGTKAFAVKLTLSPDVVKDTRYMVLGQNPFQMYREEDFQRMLNMENDPEGDAKKKTQRPGTRR